MYTFLLYIIKVSFSLAAFYLFYKLLCSRDTWHRFNRRLLLFILALSAIIPFLYIDIDVAVREASVVVEELASALVLDAEEAHSVNGAEATPTLWQRIPWQQIPWRGLLATVYLIGLLVCVVHFVGSLLSIRRLIRNGKRSELADGTILIAHDKAYGPFSWMRYVIASAQDLDENFDMILAHERAHICLHHSWDLLFVQLCAMAQWFNPAAWLLKRELEAIHEYEADSATLRQGFDARQYQLRLFEEAVGVKFNTITNNFNNCSTKKRIIMMMKRQTSPWARLKALFVLPVAFAAVTVISCTSPKEKKAEANQEPASAPEMQVVTYAPQPKEAAQGEVFQVVEEQPMFPGGMGEMMKFLQQNVKYPKEAQDQGKQGRVIVQFVVNKDGSISNDTIVRSVDPLLDAEAIRVVRSMPNWTPGKQKGEAVRVRFTLPVTFRLEGGAESKPAEVKQVVKTSTQGEEIFKVVEQMPIYLGGHEALMKYIQQNIRYPKEAQEQGKQGRVVVQFVVEKDGSITDAKIAKSVDPQLDAEALRVVNAMPNWTPGKQRGKEVRTYFTIPVTFRLSN